MKFKFTVLITFIFIWNAFGQIKKCCDTYVYEGFIISEENKKIEINLNFLVLLDSTMVGSYYSDPKLGSKKLVGNLNPDYTFYLTERDNENVTGFFNGTLNSDFKFASGKWKDARNEKSFDFEIKQVFGKSYWDYIKKNRALFEYSEIETAIKDKDKVLSIDAAHQGLTKLPKELSELSNIVSINLLGNEFETFPSVLSNLISLDEISLSSNQLKKVGSEIGKLKNLRILIMNNNQLKRLPREIGELSNLLYLEIGNNQLASLPEEIKYLTSLQELHIERNKLTEEEKQKIKKSLPKCIIHF